ncbi:hypothetical protein E2C01_077608 [Portunus trituberculatus]|uniref:Uncharacterized protein n=1 Tax=Portunus trituberculatus TaxID=210409 RepID=A0A5B7ILS9_PORTR|nr:hypothetical protein [Portunus trituberculatus]
MTHQQLLYQHNQIEALSWENSFPEGGDQVCGENIERIMKRIRFIEILNDDGFDRVRYQLISTKPYSITRCTSANCNCCKYFTSTAKSSKLLLAKVLITTCCCESGLAFLVQEQRTPPPQVRTLPVMNAICASCKDTLVSFA